MLFRCHSLNSWANPHNFKPSQVNIQQKYCRLSHAYPDLETARICSNGIASNFLSCSRPRLQSNSCPQVRKYKNNQKHNASYCAEHLKDSGQIRLSANPTFRRTLPSAHSCCALAPPFINLVTCQQAKRSPRCLDTAHSPSDLVLWQANEKKAAAHLLHIAAKLHRATAAPANRTVVRSASNLKALASAHSYVSRKSMRLDAYRDRTMCRPLNTSEGHLCLWLLYRSHRIFAYSHLHVL